MVVQRADNTCTQTRMKNPFDQLAPLFLSEAPCEVFTHLVIARAEDAFHLKTGTPNTALERRRAPDSLEAREGQQKVITIPRANPFPDRGQSFERLTSHRRERRYFTKYLEA